MKTEVFMTGGEGNWYYDRTALVDGLPPIAIALQGL